MTKEDLDIDKEIIAKATSGPWDIYNDRGVWSIYSVPRGKGWLNGKCVDVPSYGKVAYPNNGGIETMGCALGITADATFIARARNRWPKALEEIERLQAENEKLRDALDKIRRNDGICGDLWSAGIANEALGMIKKILP